MVLRTELCSLLLEMDSVAGEEPCACSTSHACLGVYSACRYCLAGTVSPQKKQCCAKKNHSPAVCSLAHQGRAAQHEAHDPSAGARVRTPAHAGAAFAILGTAGCLEGTLGASQHVFSSRLILGCAWDALTPLLGKRSSLCGSGPFLALRPASLRVSPSGRFSCGSHGVEGNVLQCLRLGALVDFLCGSRRVGGNVYRTLAAAWEENALACAATSTSLLT